jgi:copper(I)-binding protein
MHAPGERIHGWQDLHGDRVRRRPRGWIVYALLGVSLGVSTFATPLGPDIQASEAWIRWLPADLPSGGYLTLRNLSNEPRRLTGASSPEFGSVSLHQTRDAHGVSGMSPVDSILIAAHGTLQFAPGGYHMMLMQPAHALHPGDHVPITLRFADGAALQVTFEVRAADVVP